MAERAGRSNCNGGGENRPGERGRRAVDTTRRAKGDGGAKSAGCWSTEAVHMGGGRGGQAVWAGKWDDEERDGGQEPEGRGEWRGTRRSKSGRAKGVCTSGIASGCAAQTRGGGQGPRGAAEQKTRAITRAGKLKAEEPRGAEEVGAEWRRTEGKS